MAGKQFSSKQDAQRYRQDRLTEIDESIRTYQSGPQTAQTPGQRAPAAAAAARDTGLHLARVTTCRSATRSRPSCRWRLGSAYFRLQQWPDAEREFKAAIAADPKSGEAFNNLAVVYLQTGRFKEADEAVKSAEKAGYKVHPQLKQDIKAKLG